MTPSAAPLVVGLAAALPWLATGCGSPPSDRPRRSTGADRDRDASLADVSPADRPPRVRRAHHGRRRRHRRCARSPTTRAPTLPVTVTDAQGTRVTITDTSRILALDVYGTLARTVFELGLGDSVVGRDVSTAVRRGRRPAAGHPERPRPQRRGDPRPRPDRDPHRHLARPVGRRCCRCATPASPSWSLDSQPQPRHRRRPHQRGRRGRSACRQAGARWPSAPPSEIARSSAEIAAVAPADEGQPAAHGLPLRARPVAASTTCSARAPAPTR